MKKHGFLVVGALLALPILANGKLAFPNDVFGRLEASLDVCSAVDPNSATKYQEAKKELVQGATEEEVKAARDSPEYKDGYNSTKEELEKKPKAEVAKICAAALERKN